MRKPQPAKRPKYSCILDKKWGREEENKGKLKKKTKELEVYQNDDSRKFIRLARLTALRRRTNVNNGKVARKLAIT